MISETTIKNSIIEAIGADIEVVQLPSGAFGVGTPFYFQDGDPLNIVVSTALDGSLTLTDEADTLAHLTYFDVTPRADVLDRILISHAVENRNGRLVMTGIPYQDIGVAIFDFSQALLKIADMTLWKKERSQNQFVSDFRDIVASVIDHQRITFDYNPPEFDPEGLYKIDCFVRMPSVNVCFYAAYNDINTKESALSISHYKNSRAMTNAPHCIVFNSEGNISKRSKKQALDVASKSFGSLDALDRDLPFYMKEVA